MLFLLLAHEPKSTCLSRALKHPHRQPAPPPFPFTLKTSGKLNPLPLFQVTNALSFLVSVFLLLLINIFPCPKVQLTLKLSKGPAFEHERQSPGGPIGQNESVIYKGISSYS